MEFVKLVHADNSPETRACVKRLLVIEHDESNPNVESARNLGAAVLVGDVFNRSVQAKARMDNAGTIIMMLHDDKRNIELALDVRRRVEEFRRNLAGKWYRKKKGKKETTKLLIHVDDTSLARRLKDHSRAGAEKYTETRFFDFYESSARALFENYPLDYYADLQKSEIVHLAIYGFGQMGEAVLRQAVRLACFPDGRALHISIFDRRVGENDFVEGFWRTNPGLKLLEEGDSEYKPMRFSARFHELTDAQCGIKEERFKECLAERDSSIRQFESITPPTQHVICFDQDSLGASFAMSLRDALRERQPAKVGGIYYSWDAPIFVRLQRRHGLARLFLESGSNSEERNDKLLETPDSLFAFGMLDDIVAARELIGDHRDGLAKILHEDGYRKLRRIHGTQTDANTWRKQTKKAWESLALHFKSSSRAQADHIDVKLRSVGCTVSEASMTADEFSLARPGTACFEPVDQIFRAGKEFITVQRMGTILPVVTRWKPSSQYDNTQYVPDQTPQDLMALDADAKKDTENEATNLPRSWQEAQKKIQALQRELELPGLGARIEGKTKRESDNEFSVQNRKSPEDRYELILLRGKEELCSLLTDETGLKSPRFLASQIDPPWIAVLVQEEMVRSVKAPEQSDDEEQRTGSPPSLLLWRLVGDNGATGLKLTSWRELRVWEYEQDASRILLTKGSDQNPCAMAVWVDGITAAPSEKTISEPGAIGDRSGNYIFVLNQSEQLVEIEVLLHSAVSALALFHGLPAADAKESDKDTLTLALGCQDSDTLLIGLDSETINAPEAGPTARPLSTVQLAHPWMLHLRQSRIAARCDDGSPVDRDAWEQLARSEHDRWSAFHYLENWRYGEHRVDVARIHNNLQPWEKLKVGTRQYDASHVAKITMFLDRLSREQQEQNAKPQLCREIRIGIVGHRPHRLKGHLAWLNNLTDKEGCSAKGERLNHPKLDALVDELCNTFHPGPTDLPVKFVLVTCLAEGADRLLAQALLAHERLNAELQPILPLPWEIYRTTFAANPKNEASTKYRSEEQVLELIQDKKTRRHIQMPMLYGSAAEIANDKEKKAGGNPQQKQYRLANAWIVQNCDYLIAAWDGKELGVNPSELSVGNLLERVENLPDGSSQRPYTKKAQPGGTWEAVRWWLYPEAIPEEIQWPVRYRIGQSVDQRARIERLQTLGLEVPKHMPEAREKQ